MDIKEALTFDDVLLQPNASDILPNEVDTYSFITKSIRLKTPIISAAMDSVTEHQMAIYMARYGAIGCIHKNMTIEQQVTEIKKVKKAESGMVLEPVSINENAKLKNALRLMKEHGASGIPVIAEGSNKLVGILTNRDVRFARNKEQPVKELMTSENLITVDKEVTREEAKKLLHKHRIEKLLVVDKNYHCYGLITVKDIEKSESHPDASKDEHGRLRVAAATGTGEAGYDRAIALHEAGADIIVVDTSHGHSKNVIDVVKKIKKYNKDIQVIAGNIVTEDAAKALIDAGVDAVKVGVGPGSICTTRIVAGVGVPQLSAILNVVKICKKNNVKIIADGGIKFSGDFAKAIAAGADAVMIGSLIAGTDESPGEVVLYKGRSYKSYRGMGSVGAMVMGSAERYFQDSSLESNELVPQGVEGLVPYKGAVGGVLHQMIGGLSAAMGYIGSPNIELMQKNCRFVKITNAGLKESHAHDIVITREAPNYVMVNE